MCRIELSPYCWRPRYGPPETLAWHRKFAQPWADVTVVSDDTGVKQQTRTNQQGNWTVEFLLAAHYHFTVTASGFKTAQRAGIELQAANSKQIDAQLEGGSTSQSVDVTAEAPLIDSTSAASGTVITSEEIFERAGQPFWQEESYDHVIRSATEFERIRNYIESNPVTAGLVAVAEDLPSSSAGIK